MCMCVYNLLTRYVLDGDALVFFRLAPLEKLLQFGLAVQGSSAAADNVSRHRRRWGRPCGGSDGRSGHRCRHHQHQHQHRHEKGQLHQSRVDRPAGEERSEGRGGSRRHGSSSRRWKTWGCRPLVIGSGMDEHEHTNRPMILVITTLSQVFPYQKSMCLGLTTRSQPGVTSLRWKQ